MILFLIIINIFKLIVTNLEQILKQKKNNDISTGVQEFFGVISILCGKSFER